MSFLFGSSKHLQSDDPKLLGVKPERAATSESARVLPYLFGHHWIGLTWVGDLFDVKTTEVKRKVGKKSTVVGHNYYASFAGLLCSGKVTAVTGIKFDGDVVWDGVISSLATDAVDLSIESRGMIRIYWGTETQHMDPLLDPAHSKVDYYSAMRGQSYLRGDRIFLGPDRTTVPNIEVRLARYPSPSWFDSGSDVYADGCNPVAVLWDWWTNKRFGMGRPENTLDVPRLLAASRQLYAEGIAVSPLLTNTKEMRGLISNLLEYCDGYPTSYGGLFGIELARPTTVTGMQFTDRDLLADPNLTFQSWLDTYDEVRVTFRNRLNDDQDDLAKHHELANFVATGRHRPLNVDRSWVTDPGVAQIMADALGRASGVPLASGSCSVRESAAVGLKVGGVFELTLRDGSTLACRVKERTEANPDKGDVQLTFDEDVGWTNSAVNHVASAPAVPLKTIFRPLPPFFSQVLDSPYAFSDPINPSLIYMVARGDTFATDFDAYRATAGPEGPYSSAAERTNAATFGAFTVRAQLDEDYPANTAIIEQYRLLEFTVTCPESSLLGGEWALEDGLNHELLMFAGDVDRDLEVLSLFDLQKTGDNSYTAKCVRALYDTERTDHFAGEGLWIQLRPRLAVDTWPPYAYRARYYKFQPRFVQAEVALADLPVVQHTELARALRPLPPANLRANGDRSSATWLTGQDVTISWNNTSRVRTVFGLPINEAPPTDLSAVHFELRTYDGQTLVAEFDGPPTESYLLTNAYLVGKGMSNFRLRAYGDRTGWRSLHFTDVQVVKV